MHTQVMHNAHRLTDSVGLSKPSEFGKASYPVLPAQTYYCLQSQMVCCLLRNTDRAANIRS